METGFMIRVGGLFMPLGIAESVQLKSPYQSNEEPIEIIRPGSSYTWHVEKFSITPSRYDTISIFLKATDSIYAYCDAIKRIPPFKVETGIVRTGGRTRQKQRLTRLQRRHKRQRR